MSTKVYIGYVGFIKGIIKSDYCFSRLEIRYRYARGFDSRRIITCVTDTGPIGIL